MFTNGKIIVYEFMIKFYSYLYFCQSYSWNTFIRYTQSQKIGKSNNFKIIVLLPKKSSLVTAEYKVKFVTTFPRLRFYAL